MIITVFKLAVYLKSVECSIIGSFIKKVMVKLVENYFQLITFNDLSLGNQTLLKLRLKKGNIEHCVSFMRKVFGKI